MELSVLKIGVITIILLGDIIVILLFGVLKMEVFLEQSFLHMF